MGRHEGMIEVNSSFPLRTLGRILGALFGNEIFLVLVRLVESLRVLSETEELVPFDVDAPLGRTTCLNLTAVAMSMRGLVSFCENLRERFSLFLLPRVLACSPAARARAALTVRSLVPAACSRGAAGQFNLDSTISALR